MRNDLNTTSLLQPYDPTHEICLYTVKWRKGSAGTTNRGRPPAGSIHTTRYKATSRYDAIKQLKNACSIIEVISVRRDEDA